MCTLPFGQLTFLFFCVSQINIYKKTKEAIKKFLRSEKKIVSFTYIVFHCSIQEKVFTHTPPPPSDDCIHTTNVECEMWKIINWLFAWLAAICWAANFLLLHPRVFNYPILKSLFSSSSCFLLHNAHTDELVRVEKTAINTK